MKGTINIIMILLCIATLWVACGTEPKATPVTPPLSTVEKEDFPEKVINPIPVNNFSKKKDTIQTELENAKEIVAERKEKDETNNIVKEDVKKAIAKTAKTTSDKKVTEKKKAAKKKKARIAFDSDVFEFGTIKPGDVIKHKFEFTNTGDADLVIKGADVTCGCTYPSYPFIPIPPKERGFIEVTYDSKGKLGRQKPTVTLTTNAGTKKISLEGFVISEMAKEE